MAKAAPRSGMSSSVSALYERSIRNNDVNVGSSAVNAVIDTPCSCLESARMCLSEMCDRIAA